MPINLDALLRYHTINQCLQNRFRKWTWEDLAIACADYAEEVAPRESRNIPSKRTIQNDIKVMRSADLGYNAPIDNKNGFYYYSDQNFSIRNATLNKSDIQNISLAAKVLGQYKGFDFFKDLSHLFESFESKVDLKFNQSWKEKIQFDASDMIGGNEFLKPILTAITDEIVLAIDYQKFTDQQSNHQLFHPYLLKEFDNRWYVLGYGEKRNQLITLALDRIQQLTPVLGHQFKKDVFFNPNIYFADTIGVTYGGQKPEKLIIEVDGVYAPYLLSKPIHQSQQLISVKENNHIFAYKVVINTELESIILSTIDHCEILEPLWFRKQIAEKIEKALKKNS